MIFWVILAVVGLVLYANPSLFIRHMYEGFEVPQVQQDTPKPQDKPQAPMNINSMLRNLEQLISTPGINPDITPTMPTEEFVSPHVSNTGREQPQESDTQSSKPQPLQQSSDLGNKALEQGRAFQETKPQTQPVKEIIRERIVEVPRACPPPKVCPVCPDMRNYIRKDSIPCWACKL